MSRRRTLLIGAALTAILVAVAGCGRRGSLEPPPGATSAPRVATSQRIAAPVAQLDSSSVANLDNPEDPLFTRPNSPNGDQPPVATAPAPVDPGQRGKPFFLDKLVK